jgi:hypothetical protein
MIRRTLATAAAVVGIAALLPLTASAQVGPVLPKHAEATSKAQAAGVCNLSVPTRVAIGRPELNLYGKVTGDCNRAGNSSGWYLMHPASAEPVNGILFDATDAQYGNGRWEVPSYHYIGAMNFVGAFSENADGATYTQNKVPVTVKLAAGAWISSSRKADVVTLKGTSLLYSVSNDNFFKRSAGGVFQFREKGQTNWQTLKGVYTNSKGEVSLSYRYSKVRDYRFSLYSTSISWDLGSAVTTR